MTPTISTQRLSLRPLRKATPRQIGWLIDPDVVRYSEQRHERHNLKSQLRYIDSFTGNSHIWGIHVAATGDHIGNFTAVHDVDNNISDLAILIGETQCWHLGMGGEAWRTVSEWLLDPERGGIRKLEAGCMRDNIAMFNILRNAPGWHEEGERKAHFLLDGRPVNMAMFGRIR